MTARQELSSWFAPPRVDLQPVPAVNDQAISTPDVHFPRDDGKPVLIAFLRHCGCPFAEKTFQALRKVASANKDVHCIAVSHSDEDSTHRWIESVGGANDVQVIVDHDRKTYAAYGLGVSSWWHVLNPWSMATVFKLGREEKIWNRPTESGSRWQTAGEFAVDSSGVVRYSHPAQTTDDLADFQSALKSVKSVSKL